MIEWFDSDESSTDEVPWIREFIEAGGDYNTPRDVEACFVGLKGILVITERWKAFVFKGSKKYKDLIDALSVYVTYNTGLPVLVACSTESGTVQLGLDHERNDAAWKQDSKGYYQRIESAEQLKLNRLKGQSNPLIPSSIPSKNGRVPAKSPAPTKQTSQ